MDLTILHLSGAMCCVACHKHIRWMWKYWSDEDLGLFFETGLCPRCSA